MRYFRWHRERERGAAAAVWSLCNRGCLWRLAALTQFFFSRGTQDGTPLSLVGHFASLAAISVADRKRIARTAFSHVPLPVAVPVPVQRYCCHSLAIFSRPPHKQENEASALGKFELREVLNMLKKLSNLKSKNLKPRVEALSVLITFKDCSYIFSIKNNAIRPLLPKIPYNISSI